MMWNLPFDGHRALRGRQQHLFIHAISSWADFVFNDCRSLKDAIEGMKSNIEDDGHGYMFNDSLTSTPFTSMTTEQQVISVAFVAKHLFGNGPSPDLKAWSEATISAMFEHLAIAVSLEIDAQDDSAESFDPHFYFNRSSILDFSVLENMEEYDLTPDNCDQDSWELLIENHADLILWDRDFEMEELADEGINSFAKTLLGIPNDYFSDVPPNDTNTELKNAIVYILKLHKKNSKYYDKLMRHKEKWWKS